MSWPRVLLSNTFEDGNCHPEAADPSLAKPELLRKGPTSSCCEAASFLETRNLYSIYFIWDPRCDPREHHLVAVT